MSFRGGRGGGRGGSASRLNSGAIPFDIDDDLQKAFERMEKDKDSLFPVSSVHRFRDKRVKQRARCQPQAAPGDALTTSRLLAFARIALSLVAVHLKHRYAHDVMARQPFDERELNLFQEYLPHLAAPVTEKEKERIKNYLDLQDSLKNGWLSKAIEKLQASNAERHGGTGSLADFNPFEDVPQYGKKKTAQKVPKFSEFPFVKEHFPKELWDVIDPMNEAANPATRKAKKLKLATKPTRDKLADFDDADEPDEAVAEAENEEKNPDDEDFEEIQDDEFDEDENDDMADDYNAERYFSGGDEDYDEYAGGDDGGADDGY